MEYPHLTRPIHGPLGPQGPKAWNLGDFDKASASIKHSRKRSAAAKDWGSMASGIHGGNHGNIWWGATNLAKHMDSNSRHIEIFNKTQHDMIWHDQKKNTKNAVEILSIMVYSPESMGFLWVSLPSTNSSEGQRKTARPRRRCRRLGCWSTSRLKSDGDFSVDRWIGFHRRWEIFLEDFRGLFFLKCWENHGKPKFLDVWFLKLPKTNDIQRPIDVDFTWWQPPSIFGGFKGIQPALPLRWPPAFFGGHFLGHR